jgi:tRNA(Ile)-lysidine synthase
MTLPAEHLLETTIAHAWREPNWRDSNVVVAVSGGPDSVALLRAVITLKQRDGGPGRLIAAHLHHGLRGTAADEDQAWLEKVCSHLQIPLELGRADVAAAIGQGDGYEAAARRARYEFLCATAERNGARQVAVGHTANDQVETVLHRILRGTGLAGLAGMPRVRPLSPSVTLVRPLLDVRRADVLRYLQAIGQDYRTDASNANCRWTRNRLRNELLPEIREHVNAEVDTALWRLALQAGEAQQLVDDATAVLVSKCVAANGTGSRTVVKIDCRPLTDQPLLLVREVFKVAWQQAGWPLQAMGFDEWQQLAAMAMVDQPTATVNLPGDVRARRAGHQLVLQPSK